MGDDKFKGILKLTGADILDAAWDDKGNLHMKANITNPVAYTTIHSVAGYLEDICPSASIIDSNYANLFEQMAVGHKADRAKAIIKAVESVMRQELEKEKFALKAGMGQT